MTSCEATLAVDTCSQKNNKKKKKKKNLEAGKKTPVRVEGSWLLMREVSVRPLCALTRSTRLHALP